MDLSNEFLLPENERPSGFRQKAKAAFSSDFYPHYAFTWTLVVPRYIYLGQPIPFEIQVQVREDQCTAPVIPDILLKQFTAVLSSHTIVRAEKQFISNPEAGHDDILARLTGEHDNRRPFDKAHDWTKKITIPPLPPDRFTPSFKTVNISHTHSVEIKILLQAACKNISFEKRFLIDVLPPFLPPRQSHEAAVSSSAAASALLGHSAPPPPLAQEVQGVEEALPRYEEGLPEYHEATGSRPARPPKDRAAGQNVVVADDGR
ncbi:MAG: hypothetical protein INR62_09735 [Rhodospirillales bacterium]|nr:hypothetical protein [Acetobacter sp.]